MRVTIVAHQRHPFAGEVREKLFDLRPAHLARMAFIVEENEALDPVGVRLFGADGEVPKAALISDLVEEFHGVSLC